MIQLAHGLGMIAIAEGVETMAQLSCLHALGCDQFQGYLCSRPRNSVDIAEVLRRDPQPVAQFSVEEWLLGAAV
jgi:EAL domain-containing protein (putative c-di-GMP-specific phosphodiesterase class I)